MALLLLCAAVLASACNCGLNPTKKVGSRCDDDDDGVYCATSGSQEDLVVACRAGRFQQVGQCPPQYECRLVFDRADKVDCDRGGHTEVFGLPGQTCLSEGGGVCNIEAPTQLLQCTLGSWTLKHDCAQTSQLCGVRDGTLQCRAP